MEQTRRACLAALETPEIAGVLQRFEEQGIGSAGRAELIRSLWQSGAFPAVSMAGLEHLRKSVPEGSYLVERALLVETCAGAIDKVPALRVDDFVKQLLCREFLFYCNPSQAWLVHFDSSKYPYRAYCGQALPERFPAGSLSWQNSGLPRSWLFRVSPARMPALAVWVAKLGGFRPCAETHLTISRTGFAMLMEKECKRSYHRLARSLRLQPESLGLVASSWLFCEQTARITPHLGFLRKLFQENGGFVVSMGESAPNAGFQSGSETRRKLYEAGEYRPRETLVIWPKAAMIAWAERHPELNDPV